MLPDAHLRQIVRHFAHRIHPERMAPADLAALKRLHPAAPPRAFWMLWFDATTAAAVSVDDRLERVLALIARGMAESPRHAGSRTPLGHAFADLGDAAEHRFLRLLRLSGNRLEGELRALVHLLRSRDVGFDWADAARLLLHPPESDVGEEVRRRLARDYYAELFRRSQATASEETPP